MLVLLVLRRLLLGRNFSLLHDVVDLKGRQKWEERFLLVDLRWDGKGSGRK